MKINRPVHGGVKVDVSMLSFLFLGLFVVCLTKFLYGQQLDPGILKTNPTKKKVRQIYTSQLGIREKQPNSGPDVEKYLHYVNLSKGNPWCAAFVCWVYGQAGIDNPRTGWSPGLFTAKNVIWTRMKLKVESGTLKASAQSSMPIGHIGLPTTGDVFGIYFPEKGRIAHVGFIDQWGDSWLITVEGNTNESESSEGDGVYRKRRLTRSIYRVARYIN